MVTTAIPLGGVCTSASSEHLHASISFGAECKRQLPTKVRSKGREAGTARLPPGHGKQGRTNAVEGKPGEGCDLNVPLMGSGWGAGRPARCCPWAR